MNDFKLVINNTTYSVSAPIKGKSHALIALTIWLNVVKGMRSLRQLEPLCFIRLYYFYCCVTM